MLGPVKPHEELGRAILSSKDAKRAARGMLPPSLFMPPKGALELSVERLTLAPPDEALSHAEDIAARRSSGSGEKRSFYGWAAVVAEDAKKNRRRVRATPQPHNQHHADIILPPEAEEDREERNGHAQELASFSFWRSRQDAVNGV